jgi:hypothetical protein
MTVEPAALVQCQSLCEAADLRDEMQESMRLWRTTGDNFWAEDACKKMERYQAITGLSPVQPSPLVIVLRVEGQCQGQQVKA